MIIQIYKRDKLNGETFYDVHVDGLFKDCFATQERAEAYAEKLLANQKETLTLIKTFNSDEKNNS